MTAPHPRDELASRVAGGDQAAVAALVYRDHPVAELVARLAAREGAGEALTCAWQWLLGEAVINDAVPDLRGALLVAVHRILTERGHLDAEGGLPGDDRFLDGDEPWAGWWSDEGPQPWQPGAQPAPEQVVQALRRLPLSLRLLLVLHDVAAVDATVIARITNLDGDQQARLLGLARDTYVTQLRAEAVPA